MRLAPNAYTTVRIRRDPNTEFSTGHRVANERRTNVHSVDPHQSPLAPAPPAGPTNSACPAPPAPATPVPVRHRILAPPPGSGHSTAGFQHAYPSARSAWSLSVALPRI